MLTYIEQLETACREKGLNLRDVVEKEGVAYSTLWRWRTGKAECKESTARRIWERIESE